MKLSTLYNLFMEVPRLGLEASGYAWARFLDRHIKDLPRGNGDPCLIIQGLLAPEEVNFALAGFARGLGYQAYEPVRWNKGFQEDCPEIIRSDIDRINDKHGMPVMLTGHSYGGIHLLNTVLEDTTGIHSLVTKGSPVKAVMGLDAVPLYLRFIFEAISSPNYEAYRRVLKRRILKGAPDIPVVQVVSDQDGVVDHDFGAYDWGADHTPIIHIGGSHIGMGINLRYMEFLAYAWADKLEEWQRKQMTLTERLQSDLDRLEHLLGLAPG